MIERHNISYKTLMFNHIIYVCMVLAVTHFIELTKIGYKLFAIY